MSAVQPDELAQPPIPNSYWVIPGKLLAGEYPDVVGSERLERLLAAGIDCFIDLTMPGELEPYDGELPLAIEYLRKPIRDHGLPLERGHMVDILDCIDYALRADRRVYVHCRAGIGRTGMVVGCWLASRGLGGEQALAELNRLWQQSARAREWNAVPETPEQVEFVRAWAPSRTPTPQDVSPLAPVAAVEVAPAPIRGAAAVSMRDRFLGALIGLAVGDALAVPTRMRRPGEFEPVSALTGGGVLGLPPGAWSDDTAMALCLAESLLERKGFDPRDQVARYLRWQQAGYPSSTGRCVGITPSTAKALALAQWRRIAFPGSHDPNQLDPEPLSRLAPVVMYFLPSVRAALDNACDAARITCQSPLVLQACRLFAAVLHGALTGLPKERLLRPDAGVLDVAGLKPQIAALALGERMSPDRRVLMPGDAVRVLEAALWAFRFTDNFQDGALLAVNIGGRSDVVGAVYGQLAGAHYGLSGIPAAWQAGVAGADAIAGFAERLLDLLPLELSR